MEHLPHGREPFEQSVSSRSKASLSAAAKAPKKKDLPAGDVQDFRSRLKVFLDQTDDEGRKWSSSKWGVYAFYDYDGEPIYVGQTNESLRTRIGRHLTNQRTDAVAMRILDIFEVAELEIWPLWDLAGRKANDAEAKQELNAAEHTAYLDAIANSRFKAILNEKIPPRSPRVSLPASLRMSLIGPEVREEREHADIRIARRAETLSRLTAVARERGEVSEGLRRVIVVQAVRLAHLSAERLAVVEGRPLPDPAAINVEQLVGTVLYEFTDPDGLKADPNDATI